MSYYKDLSTYTYEKSGSSPNTKNVAWLDRNHPFPTGKESLNLLPTLIEFCRISVLQTRGIHCCDICENSDFVTMANKGEIFLLGSAEIRVFSTDDTIYAAPNLIYHYIEMHNYLPPAEFIHALLHGLRPNGKDYFERLSALKIDYSETLLAPKEPLQRRR